MTSADPTPDNVISAAVASFLGYGAVGAALVVLGFLYSRGWRLVSPAREKEIRDDARCDLLKEVDRALADKREADERANVANRFIIDQAMPVLTRFTDMTAALVPLLQRLVGQQEGGGFDDGRRRR